MCVMWELQDPSGSFSPGCTKFVNITVTNGQLWSPIGDLCGNVKVIN